MFFKSHTKDVILIFKFNQHFRIKTEHIIIYFQEKKQETCSSKVEKSFRECFLALPLPSYPVKFLFASAYDWLEMLIFSFDECV